jgi:hypothetical protein
VKTKTKRKPLKPIPPKPLKLSELAGPTAYCDICLGRATFVGSVPIRWQPHDVWLAKRLASRRCHLCSRCQEPDGGILSTWSVNGRLIFLTSSRSIVPNCIIAIEAPLASLIH